MTVFLLFVSIIFSALPLQAEENPLVEVQKINPRIQVDMRYKTADNFMEEVLYPSDAKCLLKREAAQMLSRVQERLEMQGLGIKIFDGYRPLSVQKKMWARFPKEGYVANPAKGSNHNRGAAVDVTLVGTQGNELPMPSAYDEFSERAHYNYQGGTEDERKNRKTLRDAMQAEGFVGISTEWWHFDMKDPKTYPVLDLPFSSIVIASETNVIPAKAGIKPDPRFRGDDPSSH